MITIAKPLIGEEEGRLVSKVLESGQLASGEYVAEFEKNFAAYIGCKFGVATSSGTTGLHAALLAAGIQKGDKVLTTPFSFIASSNAILYCGAIPIFGDIDPKTYNLSPEGIERELRKDSSIKGLLIVHLYGLPCNMGRIMKLCKKYELILIEDCAQAHGAEFRKQKVGSFGHCGIFSFYGTKNMTTGEGGMVVTQNAEIAARLRKIINHGSESKYLHGELGFNFRLTNLAAAIGLAQLSKLDDFNNSRRSNAAFLNNSFKELTWLKAPQEPKNTKHVYHQYTIQIEDRASFIQHLDRHQVGYGIHYPTLIPRQPLYQEIKPVAGDFKNAEIIVNRVISLPIHPGLSTEQLKKVADTVKAFVPYSQF